MVEQAHEESEGPSIEDADVIVAGGRGLGGPEDFALVEELAKALGGAVARHARGRRRGLVPVLGAGRPDRQDRLAEALRRARHLRRDPAQGRDAELGVIVAINKDPNAPIFEYADLGVVGDLHEIVPKLTELVRRARPREARPTTRRRSIPSEFVAAPAIADERSRSAS
jgi:electron transfer flavoprotein alpha subunit